MSIYLASLICRTFSCGNDQITYCSLNAAIMLQNKVFLGVGYARNIFSRRLFFPKHAIIFGIFLIFANFQSF